MIRLDPLWAMAATLVSVGMMLAFSWNLRRKLALDRAANARRFQTLADRIAALEGRNQAEVVKMVEAVEVRVRETTRRVDRPVPAGPTLISVPNLAAGSIPSASADSDLASRYATIWEQAEAGAPAEAIARATGQPIGQVELILGLKRRRPPTRKGPRS